MIFQDMYMNGIQLSIISLGSHQLLPVADNLYGIVLTGNVRYTYDLNSSDLLYYRSIEWSENLRFERNFTRENRRPSIERHWDYCWHKVEEFQWRTISVSLRVHRLLLSAQMAFLRKSDISLTSKNQKERSCEEIAL